MRFGPYIQEGDYSGYLGTPSLRRQEQGLRPAPVLGTARKDPRARRPPPHQPAGDGAQGRARNDLRHHERWAKETLRGESRVRFLLRDTGPRALSRQRLRAEPRSGGGDAHDPLEDPFARRTEDAQDLRL